MTALADAAAFLCQQWPCFPCDAAKRPIVARGFYAASQDEAEVREMFSRPGAALIGVPMGRRSGLFLLDIDPRNGGHVWLEQNRHRIPQTRTHTTRSGGWHFFFLWPADRRVGNRKPAEGVDIKGEGGYAIMPPSDGWRIEDASMPCEAPAWLLDLIDPPAPPQVAVTYAPPRAEIPHRYAERALDGECQAVATQREGGRNDRLNIAAVKLGSLVAAGALSEATVRAELLRAALHCGLDRVEAEKTIQSGLGFGLTQPREIPEREGLKSRQPASAHVAPSAPALGSGQPNPTQITDGGRPRTLPLVYWNDIEASLAADDFVEGVLTKGAMSVVYGPSNCGKTFWASDLSMHVATGRKWNGREVEPGGVIYCALEGGHGIRNRVAAWRKHYRLDGVEVPFAIIPVTLNLLDPDADASRLADALHEAKHRFGFPVALTVMDTLARAMAGGNENSPEDMGALVNNGTLIQQATGSHLMWIHHSGKDQAQGARGHSSLRAATDTEIEISRPDKDSPSTAKATKQREMEIEGEWTFSLQRIELGMNRRGKPVTSCIVSPAEAATETVRRLPPGARAGLVALHEALAAAGQRPVSRDIPEWARVVPLEAWRREFYARSHLPNQEAKKKAFQRAIKDLRDASVVGVMHDQAWLTDAAG